MGKSKGFINSTKNAFNDNKSLILAGIIVFIFSIVFLLLGLYFTISTESGSLFISLSASMITIIITIYLIDHIIKSGEAKRLLKEENLRKQQQWKAEFLHDKQVLSRYVGEIHAIIKIIGEMLDDDINNHVFQQNKSLMLDYLRIKIRLKLENPPFTLSFKPSDGVLESESIQSIHNNMELMNNFSRYINNEKLNSSKLSRYESEFYHSKLAILKMKPNKEIIKNIEI